MRAREASLRRWALVAFAIGALTLPSLTGCHGKFLLTKKVHEWNGQATGDPYADQIVFWGAVILQAYTVTLIVDGVVLNVVEFWTGRNPFDDLRAPKAMSIGSSPDGSLVVVDQEDGSARWLTAHEAEAVRRAAPPGAGLGLASTPRRRSD
jgi:formate hydrogenlyase subunit 3/multisubunit Na+/H+ antiporter MnhD subunit